MRTRWPVRTWMLVLLVPCTALMVFDLFREGPGPFDSHTTFTLRTRLDRQRAGYDDAPPYYPTAGYYGSYAQDWWLNDYVGYMVIDRPYWPGGDPPPGPQAPLPQLVERYRTFAVTPGIPLAALAAGWIVWAIVAARDWIKSSAPSRGFDVLTSKADPPSGT